MGKALSCQLFCMQTGPVIFSLPLQMNVLLWHYGEVHATEGTLNTLNFNEPALHMYRRANALPQAFVLEVGMGASNMLNFLRKSLLYNGQGADR